MIVDYPYTTPVVLTDEIYSEYGGETGTYAHAVRQAAYVGAERAFFAYTRTFLQPTTVTGTFVWPQMVPQRLPLNISFINSVDSVIAIDPEGGCDCDTLENDGCAFIIDDRWGYLDIKRTESSLSMGCGCSWRGDPIQARVVLNAGLPSGTAYSFGILSALRFIAEIGLNELFDPHKNESAGDIGVQSFSNQGYSEQRKVLLNTVFGSSARAQYIKKRIDQTLGGMTPALRL